MSMDKFAITKRNEGILRQRGLPLFYQKFPDSNTNPSLTHIHIDSQVTLPIEAIEKLKVIGFNSDDFVHDFRIYGKGGNPKLAYRHSEPINHLTYKTNDPIEFGEHWKQAIGILKNLECLSCERQISQRLRSVQTADELKLWTEVFALVEQIKANADFTPSDTKAAMAVFKKAGFDTLYTHWNDWAELTKEILSKKEPVAYYVEGELIPVDRMIAPKPFDERMFDQFFPKVVTNSLYTRHTIDGIREFPFNNIEVDGVLKRIDPTGERPFREGEIHITIQREGADEHVLRILGEMGFSGPAIAKYVLDNEGNLQFDENGAPKILHDIPFTIQARNMNDARKLAYMTVSMLEKVGGFESASVKIEPVIAYWVQGVHYESEMPPCLTTAGIKYNPAFLTRFPDIANGINGTFTGVGGQDRSPNILVAKFGTIKKDIDAFHRRAAEELKAANKSTELYCSVSQAVPLPPR
jgi:hypothetical protein